MHQLKDMPQLQNVISLMKRNDATANVGRSPASKPTLARGDRAPHQKTDGNIDEVEYRDQMTH